MTTMQKLEQKVNSIETNFNESVDTIRNLAQQELNLIESVNKLAVQLLELENAVRKLEVKLVEKIQNLKQQSVSEYR